MEDETVRATSETTPEMLITGLTIDSLNVNVISTLSSPFTILSLSSLLKLISVGVTVSTLNSVELEVLEFPAVSYTHLTLPTKRIV